MTTPTTQPTPAPGAFDDLLPLADVRVAELIDDGGSGGNLLDVLLLRLFDPRRPDPLTVAAFSSGL